MLSMLAVKNLVYDELLTTLILKENFSYYCHYEKY